MKSKSFYDYQLALRGLVLGLTLFASGLASAQNFVKNPDFEEPLGPANWTVVYDNCGPFDFLVAGRTTMANKDEVPGVWDADPPGSANYVSRLGGHFAPNYCEAMPHAYFKQVITGLTPFGTYICSAWMVQYTRNDRWIELAQIWMEALGGASGNVSRKTPYVTDNANNNPEGWKQYVVTNTASASGQIELRLHYNIVKTTVQVWEYRNMNAFYDHVEVRLPNQTPRADAGSDQTVECAGDMTALQLNGTGSSDPDGDPLTFEWREGAVLLGTNSVQSVSFPLSAHVIALRVVDPSGAEAWDTNVVTVVDTTPPAIICAANKAVECGAAWDFDEPTVSDNCAGTNVTLRVMSTVTNAGCGVTFTATRTWQAADSATNTATCSQTVTVTDTTLPTIVCPAPITVEFQDQSGAVVSYAVSASDTCSPASVAVTPPSGSRFPIGVTAVQAKAMDACSNASQCTFSVTVLGAQGVKSNVLAELIALRASTPLESSCGVKFDSVIEHLQSSLNPAYWIDQTHLQPKSGERALNEEKLAAKVLRVIMDSKNCPVDPAVLQGLIGRILKSDRLLATISIQEAAAAGLNAKKIAEDLAMVAKGDEEAVAGRYANAIEHYRNAWRHTIRLHLQVRLAADGSAHLQFVANNSKSFLIEGSKDMMNWLPLGTCTSDADGNVEFVDSAASSFKFYRVVER